MKILVIGTGGIAASKLPSICSALSTYNYHQIDIMLTDNAREFVTDKALLRSVKKIWTENDYMAHIKATQDIDKLVVVPATANIIEKIAHGSADDLVSSTCVKRNIHLNKIIFPVMNPDMYDNPPVQRNIDQVLRDGWIVVEPAIGLAACGDYGRGVLRSTKDIIKCINNLETHRQIKINNIDHKKKWYYQFRGETFYINNITRELEDSPNGGKHAVYTAWVHPYDPKLPKMTGSSYPVNLKDCTVINLVSRNKIGDHEIISV